MDIRTIRQLTLLLSTVVGISACQQLVVRTGPVPELDSPSEVTPEPAPAPEPVAVQPQQQTAPAVPLPPDRLPPSQRVRKALQMLEQGEYEDARNQLNWALQEKPGLQIADNLIQQIDADPIDYLGVKNFYYQVESGDSLSTIAGKFLEDPMKFVVLARYNKLENPSKLAPGDRIRVPGAMPADLWRKPKQKKTQRKPSTPPAERAGEEPPSPPRQPINSPYGDGQDAIGSSGNGAGVQQAVMQPSPPPAATLDQVLDNARKLYAMGDLPAAISQLDSEGGRYASAKAVQSLQISYYSEYAKQLLLEDELEQARGLLEKVVLLDAADEQAIKNLIQIEDKLEARRLYRLGEDLLSGEQVENAYAMFTQSLTYDPNNAKARAAQGLCRDKLTDGYHREAMRHFRNQELAQAIVLWDKILALDPEHPLAPGYRARAMEMQLKLKQIESNNQ
jgi:tetratricopeptide (TPR) repeat protein